MTETAIAKVRDDAAASGKRVEVADAGQPGLRLRVTPKGRRTWVLACRDRFGRMRRFTLGSYPVVSLTEARTAARATRQAVRQDGADPTADRRRERAMGAAARAGTWRIPDTKSGEPHVVPLSRQAMDLLRGIPRARGAEDRFIFATRTGTRLAAWDRETKQVQTDSGTEGWTRHDLRRTGATMLGEMGVVPDIIDAALNHAEIHSRLHGTYNVSRYRPQVAEALQRLGDALDGIEAGAAEVVPLRRRQ